MHPIKGSLEEKNGIKWISEIYVVWPPDAHVSLSNGGNGGKDG